VVFGPVHLVLQVPQWTIVQLQLSVYHRKITAVNRQQSWSNKFGVC